ncbi:hypothetical protein A8990_12495 [Paenibacillus taihuensis]|uniref:Uncharacterized protein n=1 Tax=Paenibacillus taihuensis TaxID=1156355 RepID=A0A3D9RJ70_9BACL|nr:hypothetical protein A8990_12495 [Paenibacillus taihuensis]
MRATSRSCWRRACLGEGGGAGTSVALPLRGLVRCSQRRERAESAMRDPKGSLTKPKRGGRLLFPAERPDSVLSVAKLRRIAHERSQKGLSLSQSEAEGCFFPLRDPIRHSQRRERAESALRDPKRISHEAKAKRTAGFYLREHTYVLSLTLSRSAGCRENRRIRRKYSRSIFDLTLKEGAMWEEKRQEPALAARRLSGRV